MRRQKEIVLGMNETKKIYREREKKDITKLNMALSMSEANIKSIEYYAFNSPLKNQHPHNLPGIIYGFCSQSCLQAYRAMSARAPESSPNPLNHDYLIVT